MKARTIGVLIVLAGMLGAAINGATSRPAHGVEPVARVAAEVIVEEKVVYQDREIEVVREVASPSCVSLAKQVSAVTKAAYNISEGEHTSAEIASRATVFIVLGDAEQLAVVGAQFRDARGALLDDYKVVASWESNNERLIAACEGESGVGIATPGGAS